MTGKPRIVIAGGGFGGMTAARKLCQSGKFDVQLVDRHNYYVFKPLLAEVATGAVTATDAVVPLRKYVTATKPVRAEVVGLDPDAHQLHIQYGSDSAHVESVDYDMLVLALGSQTEFFGIEGLAENALTLDTIGDALALRGRILSRLERAELERDEGKKRALQTFVVGGGSFTGVEVAGAINDYLGTVLPLYPRLVPADARVIIAEMKDRLLPALPERMGQAALRQLRGQGVEVRLNTAFSKLDGQTLHLSDDSTITSDSVLWAGGIGPTPMVADLPVPTDKKGRVVVDQAMRVDGQPDIYALGDCAAIPDGEGGTYPATAQHAGREGKHLAEQIARRADGLEELPFRYQSAGMMVSLGERRATALVKGRVLSGFIAWVLWRGYYLTQLPTIARRARVGADWLMDAFTGPSVVELPMFGRTDPERERAAGSPASASSSEG